MIEGLHELLYSNPALSTQSQSVQLAAGRLVRICSCLLFLSLRRHLHAKRVRLHFRYRSLSSLRMIGCCEGYLHAVRAISAGNAAFCCGALLLLRSCASHVSAMEWTRSLAGAFEAQKVSQISFSSV